MHSLFPIWTWRESNPRPKALSSKLLPSQSLFVYSPDGMPNDRLIAQVASWLLLIPQSFGIGVPRKVDALIPGSGNPGRTGRTRLPELICY